MATKKDEGADGHAPAADLEAPKSANIVSFPTTRADDRTAPPRDSSSGSNPFAVAEHTAVFRYLPRAKAELVNVDEPTKKYPLSSDVFKIGRTADNDLVLNVAGVSSLHALIEHDGSGFTIDAKGRNGLLHNDVFLKQRAPLVSGDVIQICDIKFRFVSLLSTPDLGILNRAPRAASVSEDVTMPRVRALRRQPPIWLYAGAAAVLVVLIATGVYLAVPKPVAVTVAPNVNVPVVADVVEEPALDVLPAAFKVAASTVLATSGGQVKTVHVKPGSTVAVGQVLVELFAGADSEMEDLREAIDLAERMGAKAAKKRLIAELEEKKEKHRTLMITTPVAGTVRALFVDRGETITDRAPVAEIVPVDAVTVQADLPANLGAKLAAGTKVIIKVGTSVETGGEITSIQLNGSLRTAIIRPLNFRIEWLSMPVEISLP